jgi:UDP-glucuronate decarboxylase
MKRSHTRILVTGGAGFIGSHLIDKLLENKTNVVICLDNLYSGQKKNIEHHISNPQFEFIRHDVTNPYMAEVDQIYHLACPASPVFYQHNGIKTIKTNVLGTMNMLGLAKRTNARILLSSTSEVYGDPKEHPQTEEYWGNVNNIGIRSCYDEGKRIAETLCFEYHRMHDVQIRVARIFNTYGPRMLENDGRVISNFIVQALNKKPLTVYGDGSQTRSFCYISDMVEYLTRTMNQDYIGPINVGNPDEYTILQIANAIKTVMNTQRNILIDIKFKELPSDDPKRRKPDITKAKKYLNYEPKISIDNGINKTISYFASLTSDNSTSI